ncbi:MAG: Gfo/Idh/MocA family oxidoreductase [Candidatus Omnitrophica bacterium]|nr:Gfo/Idh/MocA family oxidoreductase [Candidatus Omnitrophota bacterium]
MENTGKKVKVAVIGTGKLGTIHSRIYGELPQADLIGVCDINRERAEETAASCGVRAFTDFRELFPLAEAVSIAVPTRLHYTVAREFLKRGKHILVEKPFTSTLTEAGRLISEAGRNQCTLQVGHVERFNSAFTATQNLIKNPQFIECHRLSPFPNRSLDVGVVLDLMIHDIDIVLGLVNAPLKKTEAVGVEVLTPFEDIANARLTFETGCICNLTVSRVSEESMRKIRIFQKNTYISLDYRKEEAFIYTKTPDGIARESLPIEKEEPLKKELSSFLDCVIERRPPVVTGEIARNALAVALQIQKQIWKNKTKIS